MEFVDLHSIASLGAPRSALILPLALAGLFAVFAASYFAIRRGVNSSAYKLRNLSPEKIAAYRGRDEAPSAEEISASIVERAAQIKRSLDEEPSEIEIEMCVLGYRKCANDMITLTHLVNEEMPEAPIVRRLRLKRCRKKAIESLSAVRESLPPGVLKATRQEK